jgi:uncharacterized Zn-finger protein
MTHKEERPKAGAPAPKEMRLVPGKKASCDGGSLAGHPRVYLNMGDKDYVDCPYCGCRFVHNKAE